MALVLNSREFARYHQRLAQEFNATIMRGVRAGAARAVGYLVERTRTAPPANPSGIGTGGAVNTGSFIRRWRSVPTPTGADLLNDKGYGPIIERGRRPGGKMVPREALIPWIRRRLGVSAKEAARAYFPIARAIKRRGLFARQILTAVPAQQMILEMVRREVVEELNRELGKK